MTKDLSIIIPAKNEIFLKQTIGNILENIEANTEIIVILDGYWPEEPIADDPRIAIVHHTDSIGQRGGTNEGARISQAKYIMKVDAHCAFQKGFDRKLIRDHQSDWTVTPKMYNLHAFDWQCNKCKYRVYQGAKPKKCDDCGNIEFEKLIVWKRRKRRLTTSWRFDSDLHFQYWKGYKDRPGAKGPFMETMSCIGCCFFMERERFWELGGMDEGHGSWGQYGAELACKAWLSGGKLITNMNTWMSHMFRTDNFREDGKSSFPYKLSSKQIRFAQQYSRDYWRNNRMPNQKHPLSWLVEKFWPIPGWEESDLKDLKELE